MRHRRLLAPVLVLLVVAALFAAGQYARGELGIGLSAESVRTTVSGLAWAPIVYVAVVAGRSFLLLPSAVVLTVGGLLFGAAFGGMLGAAGLIGSGLMQYGLARVGGRDFVRTRLGSRANDFEVRAAAAGPLLVAVNTAHPAGLLTPFHVGAGLAAMPLLTFAGILLAATPFRSFLYCFFGSTLLTPGTTEFYVACGVLVVVALVPLAHRPTRERFFSALRPLESGGGGESGSASPS